MDARTSTFSPAIGNQARLRLLRRATPAPPKVRQPGVYRLPGPLQAKLAVGSIDDPLEHEAVRIADHVMRMAAPPTPSHSAENQLSRKCAHCEEEEEEEEENEDQILHKKSAPLNAGSGNTHAPPIVHKALNTAGQPLDPDSRNFFEPRFGHDFDRVRVHTGQQAAESAAAVGALAYTVGQNVVFAEGQYAPHSPAGRRLMAHELSHVIQQTGNAAALQRTADALSPRDAQLACVVRLGGCASSRDGGVPSETDIPNYNAECRIKTHYPDDITPTNEECRNPPQEPLSTTEKIVLGAFLLVGAAVVVVATIAAGEVIIPIVIASVGEAATAASVFYLSNALVVNDVGLFAAGLLIACEGNVPGLLRALADDPLWAAYVLGEVLILHSNVRIANGPTRRAAVPVKLLPAAEQTDPSNIRFRTAGPPQFEDPVSEQGATPPQPKAAAQAPENQPAAPPPNAATTPAPQAAGPGVDWEIDQSVERGIVEEAQSSARPSQPRPQAPPSRGAGAAARQKFNSLRDGYAKQLGVASGGQVHHAIELQVLDRYPGAYTEAELNALPNMRGIPPENNNLRQLHNAKIRDVIDRHYRGLDRQIASRGLQPGTSAYNQLVRSYLEDSRAELDYTLGQFFAEQRSTVPK